MIAKLRGKLVTKQPGKTIIDVNGVGYELHIPLSTFYDLPEVEMTVSLHTYTHVREDTLILFGFKSLEEKEAFELLLSVSKIGPKVALNILSGISVRDFRMAVSNADLRLLSSVPGVGPKTAERITFELKGKTGLQGHIEEDAVESETSSDNRVNQEAISALMNLGYPFTIADKTVKSAANNTVEGETLQELIRESLKILSG